jgi:hypothetical protein
MGRRPIGTGPKRPRADEQAVVHKEYVRLYSAPGT